MGFQFLAECSQQLRRRTCDQQVASLIPGLLCRVSIWMGDRLRVGKPSRYVTNQPSIPPG